MMPGAGGPRLTPEPAATSIPSGPTTSSAGPYTTPSAIVCSTTPTESCYRGPPAERRMLRSSRTNQRRSAPIAMHRFRCSPSSGFGVRHGRNTQHVTHGHAAGVQREDLRVEPGEPGLTLPDQLRLEAARAIARHLDLDFAELGLERLGAGPVARVAAAATAGGVPLVVALRRSTELTRVCS